MVKDFFERLDKFYEENQFHQAEQFLEQSLQDSAGKADYEGCLTVLSEMTGYYRTAGRHEEGMLCVEQMLGISQLAGIEGTPQYGTLLLNAATECRAAGEMEKAKEYYDRAETLIKTHMGSDSYEMASLYNNRSILYAESGRLKEAKEELLLAMNLIGCMENSEFEMAVSYTNLGNICFGLNDIPEGIRHMEKAVSIFEKNPDRKDAHYAAALSGLAEARFRQGDLEKAVQYYEKTLCELEQTYGKNGDYVTTEKNLEIVKDALHRKNAVLTGKRRGMDLARGYYKEYVKPMLLKKYPAYAKRIAVGLSGEGSECLGYDDEYSSDHDFGPGVCLWLTKSDYDAIGAALSNDYAHLPGEYAGFPVRNSTEHGKNRVGVFEIGDFYRRLTGHPHAPASFSDWMQIPEEALRAAVSGEVFEDELGEFTRRREGFLKYPEEVRLEKLALELGKLAQTGQYNFSRMKRRGDFGAVYLTTAEFIQSAIHAVYLLNQTYMPYYKWKMRGLLDIETAKKVREAIEQLMRANLMEDGAEKLMEDICDLIRAEVKRQGFSSGTHSFLEMTKEEVFAFLTDMRNRKYTEKLIDSIVAKEWAQFGNVQNEGGRAACQDDWETFSIMRKSQFLTWETDVLESYLDDLQQAEMEEKNLLEEKYARMLFNTDPKAYEKICDRLPPRSEERIRIQEEIIRQEVLWAKELEAEYPKLRAGGRKVSSSEDTTYETSVESYLRGELGTYSDETIQRYQAMIEKRKKEGRNPAKENLLHTVRAYGYFSLEEAEEKTK